MDHKLASLIALLIALLVLAPSLAAQSDAEESGRRGPPGQGGPGGMSREEIELVAAHDRDGDGWLNSEERGSARSELAALRARGAGRGPGSRPGRERGAGFGARGGDREPATPGPRVEPGDVDIHPDTPLYDAGVLRTIFLTFEHEDWEAELHDFYNTDVEVPADMVVDGATYADVGVSFRGQSSYMMVPAGFKRSLNVSLDLADEDQRLYGYKTLNLLNCNGDPSLMSTVLYSHLSDGRLAVPKANFVKVVINGEYWGVYTSVQQFDKIFAAENFGSSKGTRWKVPGSPAGDGGLAYHGEDLEPYKARYEMKSDDGDKAWRSLVELCRILNETPLDRLAEALDPVLDIDGALWFLAYDVVFSNSDGYWTRASDYSIFRDRDGRFHLIPHDMNEAFQVAGHGRGPGGSGLPPDGFRRPSGAPEAQPRVGPTPGGRAAQSGGPRRGVRPGSRGGGGVTLDPLTGIDDERLPLRSRLLAVPELRERYMHHVREIARTSLDWDQLGPCIERYRSLIDEAVARDTRRLDTYQAFLRATETGEQDGAAGVEGSLQSFATQRRAFLLRDGEATERP